MKPQKVLVIYDAAQPLNTNAYQVHILQNSNIADDNVTVLPNDNPVPVMNENLIKDLAFQVLKAQAHFKPLLGADKTDFSLDLEFKIDALATGSPAVYIKQARPYID